MSDVATLYVRNVPPKLYAELKRWAAASGRSVNGEMLALLEREASRRRERGDWWRKVQELRAEIGVLPGGSRAEDLIREDRDHGH
jgi:hypothetical protein